MKSYEQMAQDALRRIAEGRAKKARQRRLLYVAVPAVCAAVALAVGLGVWRDAARPKPPVVEPDSPVTSTTTTTTVTDSTTAKPLTDSPTTPITTTTVQTTPPTVAPTTTPLTAPPTTAPPTTPPTFMPSPPSMSEDNIVFNEIDKEKLLAPCLPLLKDEDFVPMNEAALREYYGTWVTPRVPSDLTNTSQGYFGRGECGIYRSEERGIYWDQQILFYSAPESIRRVTVQVAKGHLPLSCALLEKERYIPSTVAGQELWLGRCEESCRVWFSYGERGFLIETNGLTDAEVVTVIRSILQ